MQRFRIAGLYAIGVTVILVLAVWGVSLRRTSKATGATVPTTDHGSLAANQPQANAPATWPPDASLAATNGNARVSIKNSQFVPEELMVPAGTTVMWINADDVPHTATSSTKPRVFDSKLIDIDQTYSFQFKTPGAYEYFCKVHPHMVGRIIVK